MMADKKLLGHLLAAISIFIWGTTFISTKILLQSFQPVQIVIIRFVIGYLVLAALTGPRNYIPRESGGREALYAAAGLFGVTLYFLGENIALTYTQASNVSVIITIAPCVTAILSWLVLKEKVGGPLFFCGFGLALAGIILMSFTGNSAVSLNPLGDILAMLAACTWAVYSVLLKKIEKFGYSVFRITRRIFAYGICFLAPAAFFCDWKLDVRQAFSLTNILNYLYLGVFACALCYVAWNKATEYLGAVETSVYIYANPVVTIVFSMLFLKERITLAGWIGIALAMCGLILSEWKTHREKRVRMGIERWNTIRAGGSGYENNSENSQ